MCAHESCPEPYNRFAEMAMVNICFLVAIPYFFLWLALADSNSSLSNKSTYGPDCFHLVVMSFCCGKVSVMLPVKVTCRDGHLSHPTQREWWVETPDEVNIWTDKIKAFMNIL